MKNRNFVNVNVNPCKMCMPMGAALAFKGLEKSMVLLHGSQGCSTYMRRHMASHYNEPVDIASSSLTEQGTVYGGEDNLKNGLKNVIQLYSPKVIGIATTCLAETIGEDTERMVKEYSRQGAVGDTKLVTVATPGYGGSSFEGYYLAVRMMIENLTEVSDSNGKVNIIVGSMTPADIRRIKSILELFSIKYTIIPDISETLDGPYSKDHEKLPSGGTTLDEVKGMGGAIATIEFGATVDDSISPAKLLEERFNIPYYRLPLPIGLSNSGRFLQILSNISGNAIPKSLDKKRGRMLDAMIDSHKHNGLGRVAIFGDPELVYAVAKLSLENGIFPALIATGAKNKRLESLLQEDFGSKIKDSQIISDTDFEKIREYVKELNINLLIGHSDGKFITEKEGVPLVRIGFPIHDRVGAQRKVSVGYEGSVNLLDRITNTLLQEKYSTYREDTYNKYFKKEERGDSCESGCKC